VPACETATLVIYRDSFTMALLADAAGLPNPRIEPGKRSWWGTQISDITVNVESLEDSESQRLGILGCCSRATGVLRSCCVCCTFAVLLPAICLVFGSELDASTYRLAVMAVGLLVLAISCCLCCCSLRHTCCEGIFNLPEPAPLIPPLSKTPGAKLEIKKLMLVYNPNAGKRQAKRILEEMVLPGLQRRGIECTTIATESVGHARHLGMTLPLADFQAVVTLGGDGTFHELVNGMFSREDGKQIPVSLIPLGTGNGLSATLRQNIRRQGEEVSVWSEMDAILDWCLDRISAGHVALVDLLEVEVMNRRLLAVMMVYLGLFAEVDVVAEPMRWLGPARFDIASILMILKQQPQTLRCKLTFADGTVQDDSLSTIGACMGLCQHFSDKLRSVPQAQLDDGLAEFSVLSSGATVDQTFAGFLKLPNGAHTGDKDVWDSKQVTSAEIVFDGPGIFNVDGEVLEHDGLLRIRVLPAALQLLVGKDEASFAGPAEEAVLPTWSADPARWRMLLLFMFGCMANQAMWIGFAPIEVDVMKDYGVSSTYVNFLSLVFMIVYLPANFPASYAMDVLGCRWALLVGGCLQTFGAVLRCLPADPVTARYLVMAGQALAAVGQPFFTDMPPKIAADWFPAYQRVLADTLASLSISVGAAVGFILPATLGLRQMLYLHLAWSALSLGLTFLFFRAAPATPPSPRKHHEGKSFGLELAAALSNGNLWCLILSFSCSLGSFNTLSTLAAQLVGPFGYSADDASIFGVACTICGVLGALVMSVIVGLTGKHKPVLTTCCVLCVLFALLAALTVIYVGDGPGGLELLALAFGGLGFSAMPLMPISFEAAIMVSQAGEGTLAGLCMSGGQILGIGQTLILGQLLQSGHPKIAWIISGGLFCVALLAVSLFAPKSNSFHLPLPEESDVEESRTSCSS